MKQVSLPLFADPPSCQSVPSSTPDISPSPPQPAPPQAQSQSQSRPLWLCIDFPALALEALALDASAQVAVVVDVAGRCLVYLPSAAALEAGVSQGMPLNAALAHCPALVTEKRQPAHEQALLARRAAWAGDFSSQVSLDGNSLLLEVRGSLKLFGGLKALHRRICADLAAQGGRFCVAAAPTPAAARLLAQHGIDRVVSQREQLRSALARLPIHSLPLPALCLRRLARTGVRVLGDLWRLPRDGLARRFGVELLDFLDRAVGVKADPRCTVEQTLRFEAAEELYMASDCSAFILAAAESLFGRLVAFLHRHDVGASRLLIKLFHQQREATEVVVGLCQLSRDGERFHALLAEHLNRLLLPAPVVSVALVVDELLPYGEEKPALFDGLPAAGRDWLQTLEDLQSRLGPEAVQTVADVADHRPERAWVYGEAGKAEQPGSGPLRPAWLLPQPQRLDRARVVLLQGPERIESGWWTGQPVRRDYFQAQDGEGARLWVFRDLSDGQWYLHGLFA